MVKKHKDKRMLLQCVWDGEKLPAPLRALCMEALRQTVRTYGFVLPCVVEVHILNEDGIREINSAQRGVDAVTDVLSFPLLDGARIGALMQGAKPQAHELELPGGRVALGEILICWPRAKLQAQTYGHSEQREMAFLCIHGMLHLLGEDHMAQAMERRMRELQTEILKELHLEID